MFDSICFIDTETKGREPDPFDDVTKVGAARYFETADVIMLQYAIDDAPVNVIENWDGISWDDIPDDLKRFWWDTGGLDRKVFCAWNVGFDLTALMFAIHNAPDLHVTHMVDAMAQAAASNLPPSLEGAGRAVGKGHKQQDGKYLINLFCKHDSEGSPETHPQEWARFRSYGVQDVNLLRDIWHSTRPLTEQEWLEYWAAEAINFRGIPVDLHFAERADQVAQANIARSNRRLAEITAGLVSKVTQRERILNWVWSRCAQLEHAECLEIMTRAVKEDPDNPEDYYVTRKSIKRDRIERMLVYFDSVAEQRELSADELEVIEVLTIRQWDGSSAPAKFGKMLLQASNGKLFNSYVFNGAGQTGRFSSRGLQLHNMVNKFIGMEEGEPEMEAEAFAMIDEIANRKQEK